MAVRAARPSDAYAIASVHVAAWRATYRGLLPDDVLSGLSVAARERMWAAVLADPPPRSAILVTIAETAVLGFVSVGPAHDAGPTESEVGELYAIYLHPDQWGRGIGARLHSAAMHRLGTLGFHRAVLWVLEDNQRATSFYRREGWSEDGHRKVEQGPDGVELPVLRLHRPVPSG
jgi:GNAT superfamily N-acetyltransferase